MADDKTTPKLSINDLKYIVMEGGGARGAVYLGAIRELEKQLETRINGDLDLKNRKKAGIMDFLNEVEIELKSEDNPEDNNKNENTTENKPKNTIKVIKPIIEGVAGASAGAITTFAIVLGLNSEEIKEVLDFPFANFLSETDAGKYRMIDENSQLKVGEDDKIDKAINHPSLRFKKAKGLGLKNESFKYNLDKNKSEIQGNLGKNATRELTFTAVTKIIVDGITYNLGQIMKLFSNNKENNWYKKLIEFFFGKQDSGSIAGQTAKNFALRTAYTSLITGGILALFNIKTKNIKITPNSIMAVFYDRGMFSGFQVREFFFDLMIYAASKDTYFQKRLITYFNDKTNLEKYIEVTEARSIFNLKLTQKDFINKYNQKSDFEIGKRSQFGFSENFKVLLEHLQHLTFREFYNILDGVEFAVSVSNYTTNSPLYFSDKYTPNARVLEAVAASMSIPPAIRPVYNAGDVLLEPKTQNEIKDDPSQIIRNENIRLINKKSNIKVMKIDVIVNGEPREFIKEEGGKISFKKSDYEIYEYAFKKGFQSYLNNREENRYYIDTNNPISLNTFLEEMQKILIGRRVPYSDDEFAEKWTDRVVDVEGNKYKITIDLMRFFYNAQFKGLLLDGGYFNNIPFNFFRDKGEPNKIDNVLAIKLDGSFPPEFLNSLDQNISKFKLKVEEVINQIEREEFMEAFSVAGQKLDLNDNMSIDLQPLYKFIALQFNLQLNKKDKKEVRLQRETIRKIVKEWYKYYGAHNNLKPWEIPRPILDIAFTGYSYGSERGQIRDISDHNNIIPLYDYGVGTYDFDLEKVKSLVNLAQAKAENAVKKYFSN